MTPNTWTIDFDALLKYVKFRHFNFKCIIQLCVFILWGCFCQIKSHVSVAFCITYHTVCEKRADGGNKTNIPPLHVHAEHAIANISIKLA